MPGPVEELLVFLRANTSDFEKKMTAAGAQVESFGTRGSAGLAKFASFGGAALGVAAAGVALVGTLSVKAAIDNEKANARLENALKRTGLAYDQEKGKIDAANAAMIKKGFSDDESTDSLAKLVLVTHDVAKATQDQKVAADLAAGRNISLASATDLLVKVESGRYTQLGRLGVATKDQIAGFKTSGEAVQFLSDKYQGAAARAADTFAGRLKVLQATLEKTAADIGEKLLPIIEGLASGLSGTIQFFDENRSAALALGIAVGAVLVPAMATFVALKVASAVSAITDGFSLGVTAVRVYASELADVVAGTTALGEASAAAKVGVVGIAAAAAAASYFGARAMSEQADKTGLLSRSTDKLAHDSLPRLTSELRKQAEATDDPGLLNRITHFKLWGDTATGNSRAQKQFNEILDRSPQFAGHFIDAMKAAGLSTTESENALAKHDRATIRAQAASERYQLHLQALALSTGSATQKEQALADAYDKVTKANDQAASAVDRYRNAIFAAFDADFALIDSTRQLDADLRDSSKTHEDLEKDILAVTKAAGEKAAADLGPNATASAQSEAAKRGEIAALEGLKAKYPEMGPVIDGYIGKLGTVPPVKVTVPIFDKNGAEHDVQVLQSDIDALHGTTVTIQMAIAGAEGVAAFIRNGRRPPGGASGISIPGSPGTPFPMIAHGGEVVLNASQVQALNQGAMLVGRPSAISGGGGGDTYNIYATAATAGQVADMVVEGIRTARRRNGSKIIKDAAGL